MNPIMENFALEMATKDARIRQLEARIQDCLNENRRLNIEAGRNANTVSMLAVDLAKTMVVVQAAKAVEPMIRNAGSRILDWRKELEALTEALVGLSETKGEL